MSLIPIGSQAKWNLGLLLLKLALNKSLEYLLLLQHVLIFKRACGSVSNFAIARRLVVTKSAALSRSRSCTNTAAISFVSLKSAGENVSHANMVSGISRATTATALQATICCSGGSSARQLLFNSSRLQ
jgi:hypothetical protein